MSRNNFASRNSSSLNNGAPLTVDTRVSLYSFKLISAVLEEITQFLSDTVVPRRSQSFTEDAFVFDVFLEKEPL